MPDGAGDVVAPGAFRVSLSRRPPDKVRMLYQHFTHEPLGVWETIREDSRGLYVKGRLVLDVRRAREVRALIREGALTASASAFAPCARRAKRAIACSTKSSLGNFGRDLPVARGIEGHGLGGASVAAHIREVSRRIGSSE